MWKRSGGYSVWGMVSVGLVEEGHVVDGRAAVVFEVVRRKTGKCREME